MNMSCCMVMRMWLTNGGEGQCGPASAAGDAPSPRSQGRTYTGTSSPASTQPLSGIQLGRGTWTFPNLHLEEIAQIFILSFLQEF